MSSVLTSFETAMKNPLLAFSIPDTFFNSSPNAQTIGTSLGSFVSNLLPNVLVVAGVIFFLFTIYYGFNMIIGAGRHKSPQEIAKDKSLFSATLVGFLLVIVSYFILQILSYVTGVNFINPNVS